MGRPKEHQQAYQIAEVMLHDLDPEGKLGLQLGGPAQLNLYGVCESEDEVFLSEDVLADLPSVGALLLVRDAHRIYTGDVPTPTPENMLWMEGGSQFKDAAFSLASLRFREQYLNLNFVGAAFRRHKGKIALTLRPANPIERAKNEFAQALLGQAAEKFQQTVVELGKQGKRLSYDDLREIVSHASRQ
jgi:hypothetical protein